LIEFIFIITVLPFLIFMGTTFVSFLYLAGILKKKDRRRKKR